MNGKIVLAGTIGGFALAVALIFWMQPHFFRPREKGRPNFQGEELRAAATHLNEVMHDVNRSLKISQVIRGGPELVGGAEPFAVYSVILARGIPKETYFFDRQEYTKDIGSGVETDKLCEAVAASAPNDDPQQEEGWSGSSTVDEAQVSLGPIQFPLRALASDLARLFGFIAREPTTSFRELEILIKGFADGTVGNWELDVKGDPYDFHRIEILPQLDPKTDMTPRKFAAHPSAILIGKKYRNEHLGNLRAAFVAQDIITPMLEDCLRDKSVKVRMLEGYVSDRPHNPLQRKVEVVLNFY